MKIDSFQTTLRDGTPVLIRPVGPDDKHALQTGLEHMSSRSRYFRFFGPVSKLSEERLDYFTSADQIDHIAVGAVDLSKEDPEPVGIARCVRLKDQPDTAEIAVAIVDDHHGRGLGTILLAAVAHAAAAHHIRAFVATVLTANRAMLDLFKELDDSRHSEGGGVLGIRFAIHTDPENYPDTPVGRSFRQVYRLIDKEISDRSGTQ